MINGICMQNKFILQQSSSRIDIYIAAFGVLSAPLPLLQHPWMFPAMPLLLLLNPLPCCDATQKDTNPSITIFSDAVVVCRNRYLSLFTNIPPSTTHHSVHSYYWMKNALAGIRSSEFNPISEVDLSVNSFCPCSLRHIHTPFSRACRAHPYRSPFLQWSLVWAINIFTCGNEGPAMEDTGAKVLHKLEQMRWWRKFLTKSPPTHNHKLTPHVLNRRRKPEVAESEPYKIAIGR